MHKPELVLENETHKILWDLEIQMDHLIIAKRLDVMLINTKKTCHLVNFAFPVDHAEKIEESVKRDKYKDLARDLKRLWNMRVKVLPIVASAALKGLERGLEELKIRRRLSRLQHYQNQQEY